MNFKDIKVEVADAIGTITIDHGDGRNALRPDTLREICRALDDLTADTAVKAIVLESSMDKEWSTKVLAQSILLGTDDFKEGLEAVMERRSGRFVGR
jgi:hypothetical protein